MTRKKQLLRPAINSGFATSLTLAFFMLAMLAPPARAQTFTVLHSFTGGADGARPYGGLTMDRNGRLYGTAIGAITCRVGCGNVYRLSPQGSGWVLTPLYQFYGMIDGSLPESTVTIASDGSLFGTTTYGGGSQNCDGGCGTVYRLQPPAQVCPTVSCRWTETILYAFPGLEGMAFPFAGVAFDQAGNLFGGAAAGPFNGGSGTGGIYELTPAQGHWNYQTIYAFPENNDGCNPLGTPLLDAAGNIRGTTRTCGQYGNGTIYELSPNGSGWSETYRYIFGTPPDGRLPEAGLISDAAGNLYGTTTYGGLNDCGEVFELSPANGSYTYTVLYNAFSGRQGPNQLAIDRAGNLYGAQYLGGAHNFGMIFKLSPGSGGWTFTDVRDFAGPDGENPYGQLVFDSNGNLYGTAQNGGSYGEGVIWELTP